MKVLILGTGCYNCLSLEMLIGRLLRELTLLKFELTRVDDLHRIREFIPEDEIPGLVINDRLVSSGRIPGEAEVRHWLSEAAQLEQVT